MAFKKVMVVDPDLSAFEGKGVVDEKDMEVIPVANLLAARSIIGEYRPHVVILSSEIEGARDFARYVSKRTDARIVLTSPDPQLIDRHWKTDLVVPAPLTPQSIREAVARCLDPNLAPEAVDLSSTQRNQEVTEEDDFWKDDSLLVKKWSRLANPFARRQPEEQKRESLSGSSGPERGSEEVLAPQASKVSRNELGETDVREKIIHQEVISVYSTKGGVGRTLVAAHLAHYLRKFNPLLIDLNFAEGPSDLSINWQLPKIPHLGKFITAVEDRKSCFGELVVKSSASTFDIVQTPPTLRQSDRFDLDTLADLISVAKRRYGMIIVDLPYNYSNITLEMLNLSSLILLISTPELGPVARLKEMLHFLDQGQRAFLVINNYDGRGMISPQEIVEYLDIPLGAVIYYDAEIAEIASRGQFASENSVFGRGILDLMSHVLGIGERKSWVREKLRRNQEGDQRSR
ncbi:AAA family ATPase [Candidatus Hakubella thermalkaliphila]|uniref:CobQ/CobB/MinD/ParA nucleotide binding domain-containing protein n=3 Tax=Candidatus Hakubella thermalkaliphila TaxID=2754717 RepID=A0A6V8P8Y9_9ACTN|nr:AAA family ATPase [Candidatus Hakubella thermalkaliphila]GFP27286.1 hypothetical protein HKBW3S33_00700 [Candidatus Hakubella thermalkaliphila]